MVRTKCTNSNDFGPAGYMPPDSWNGPSNVAHPGGTTASGGISITWRRRPRFALCLPSPVWPAWPCHTCSASAVGALFPLLHGPIRAAYDLEVISRSAGGTIRLSLTRGGGLCHDARCVFLLEKIPRYVSEQIGSRFIPGEDTLFVRPPAKAARCRWSSRRRVARSGGLQHRRVRNEKPYES